MDGSIHYQERCDRLWGNMSTARTSAAGRACGPRAIAVRLCEHLLHTCLAAHPHAAPYGRLPRYRRPCLQ